MKAIIDDIIDGLIYALVAGIGSVILVCAIVALGMVCGVDISE